MVRSGRPPIVVLDAATWDELAVPADSLRARGWLVVDRLDALPLRVDRLVCRALIVDEPAAASAVLAASWGAGLLVGIGNAEPSMRERLLDDLGRIGPLVRGLPLAAPAVHPEAATLLDLLAAGHTLGEAAREAYLSRRTADRRLAEAKRQFGVSSLPEAIARWVSTRRQ